MSNFGDTKNNELIKNNLNDLNDLKNAKEVQGHL